MALTKGFWRKELAQQCRSDDTDLSLENECSRAEVLSLLGIADATLKTWVSTGQIPCRKLCKRPIFFRTEILEFRKMILQRG